MSDLEFQGFRETIERLTAERDEACAGESERAQERDRALALLRRGRKMAIRDRIELVMGTDWSDWLVEIDALLDTEDHA